MSGSSCCSKHLCISLSITSILFDKSVELGVYLGYKIVIESNFLWLHMHFKRAFCFLVIVVVPFPVPVLWHQSNFVFYLLKGLVCMKIINYSEV